MEERVERLTKIEAGFLTAFVWAARNTCDRLRTCCVFLDEKGRVISLGYNGSVSELEHCDEVGHLVIDGHCLRTIHGEKNAIFNCDNLERLQEATALIIGTPCIDCMKAMLQVGIKYIFYTTDYQNAKGKEYIEEMVAKKGVEFRKIDIDFRKLMQKLTQLHKSPGGVFNRLE